MHYDRLYRIFEKFHSLLFQPNYTVNTDYIEMKKVSIEEIKIIFFLFFDQVFNRKIMSGTMMIAHTFRRWQCKDNLQPELKQYAKSREIKIMYLKLYWLMYQRLKTSISTKSWSKISMLIISKQNKNPNGFNCVACTNSNTHTHNWT